VLVLLDLSPSVLLSIHLAPLIVHPSTNKQVRPSISLHIHKAECVIFQKAGCSGVVREGVDPPIESHAGSHDRLTTISLTFFKGKYLTINMNKMCQQRLFS
jgi:hypothetical protein